MILLNYVGDAPILKQTLERKNGEQLFFYKKKLNEKVSVLKQDPSTRKVNKISIYQSGQKNEILLFFFFFFSLSLKVSF